MTRPRRGDYCLGMAHSEESAYERASRSMGYPRVIVERLPDNEIAVSFVVPHSKFGSVSVKLADADAESMAADILEAIAR